MRVTVLGTANAWGPGPFLKPPVPCPMTGKLSDRTAVEIRKYRTSLLVGTGEGKGIRVDCGPDFFHQMRDFQFGLVDAIFITHPHFDHIGGLDDLNLYRPTRRLPIPVSATRACWDTIKTQRGLGYVVDPLQPVSEQVLFQDSNSASFSVGSVTCCRNKKQIKDTVSLNKEA